MGRGNICRSFLAALIIGFAAISPGACVMAAEACPVDDKAVERAGGYVDAVEAAVKAGSTCERSYETFMACQLGFSGDQGKCEPLFTSSLSPAAGPRERLQSSTSVGGSGLRPRIACTLELCGAGRNGTTIWQGNNDHLHRALQPDGCRHQDRQGIRRAVSTPPRSFWQTWAVR